MLFQANLLEVFWIRWSHIIGKFSFPLFSTIYLVVHCWPVCTSCATVTDFLFLVMFHNSLFRPYPVMLPSGEGCCLVFFYPLHSLFMPICRCFQSVRLQSHSTLFVFFFIIIKTRMYGFMCWQKATSSAWLKAVVPLDSVQTSKIGNEMGALWTFCSWNRSGMNNFGFTNPSSMSH